MQFEVLARGALGQAGHVPKKQCRTPAVAGIQGSAEGDCAAYNVTAIQHCIICCLWVSKANLRNTPGGLCCCCNSAAVLKGLQRARDLVLVSICVVRVAVVLAVWSGDCCVGGGCACHLSHVLLLAPPLCQSAPGHHPDVAKCDATWARQGRSTREQHLHNPVADSSIAFVTHAGLNVAG